MTKRRLSLGALALGCALAASSAVTIAQTGSLPEKDDLFAGTEKFAQGASSVTQIDMDPDSLGKVEGKEGLRARSMVLSVVHTYAYDKPGMYRIEDVEAFRKKLETGDWHCSVHIRDNKKGESVDVCNRRRTDELTEQATITVDAKSLTFIHTIRKGGSWNGTSELSEPLGMGLLGPQMQVEMAVMRAQMQARMAGMQLQVEAGLAGMKDFKGPDAEQMRHLQAALKGLEREQKSGDVKPAP